MSKKPCQLTIDIHIRSGTHLSCRGSILRFGTTEMSFWTSRVISNWLFLCNHKVILSWAESNDQIEVVSRFQFSNPGSIFSSNIANILKRKRDFVAVLRFSKNNIFENNSVLLFWSWLVLKRLSQKSEGLHYFIWVIWRILIWRIVAYTMMCLIYKKHLMT